MAPRFTALLALACVALTSRALAKEDTLKVFVLAGQRFVHWPTFGFIGGTRLRDFRDTVNACLTAQVESVEILNEIVRQCA